MSTGQKEHSLSTFSNPLTEYSPQMEFGSGNPQSQEESAAGVFDEAQELQLAARLLEVVNDQQLHRFLDDVIHETGSIVGSVVKPLDAQAIRDVLTKSIHQILPIASTGHGARMRTSVGAQRLAVASP